MILKELYLYPDLIEYDKEYVRPFRDQSRSICNYLERQLKQIKFDAEGFKRICFVGKSQPADECFVNSSKILVVEIPFDIEEYKSTKVDALNQFFSRLLIVGIEKCNRQIDIPDSQLIESTKAFIDSGSENKWLFKTKVINELGVKCSLNCELTLEAFHLRLDILKGKELIHSAEILQTPPDELVFVPMFKDVKHEGDCIVVTDKSGNAIHSLPVSELELG